MGLSERRPAARLWARRDEGRSLDEWPVDDASLTDGVSVDSAIIQSTEGYVANNVLVLRVATEAIPMRGPLFSMDLDLTDVVVSAIDKAPKTDACN